MAVLRREEVVDDWSVLIGNANGKAEEVFTAPRDLIAVTKVPKRWRSAKGDVRRAVTATIVGARGGLWQEKRAPSE